MPTWGSEAPRCLPPFPRVVILPSIACSLASHPTDEVAMLFLGGTCTLSQGDRGPESYTHRVRRLYLSLSCLLLVSFGHQGNKSKDTVFRSIRGTFSPFAWASIPKRRTDSLKYFFILSLLGMAPVCADFFKLDWAIRIW